MTNGQPPSQQPQPNQPPQPTCPLCGPNFVMRFVSEHSRYYCDRCQQWDTRTVKASQPQPPAAPAPPQAPNPYHGQHSGPYSTQPARGGLVAVLVVVIIVLLVAGGIVLAFYLNKEEPTPKPKQKALIETGCVMNGFGQGKCTFTNKGKGSGAQCAKVVVFQTKNPSNKAVSSSICSGTVEPMTTKKVEFMIPSVNDLCSARYGNWKSICAFRVVAD